MVFTTTKFHALTNTVAESFDLPDLRYVVANHPLGGTSEDVIVEWADQLVDDVMKQLTG